MTLVSNLIGQKVLIEFEIIRSNDYEPNLYWLRATDQDVKRQIWLYDETIKEAMARQAEVELNGVRFTIVQHGPVV